MEQIHKPSPQRRDSGLTSRAIEEPGIGTRLRVWEMGEVLLTDPKCVVVLSGSTT